MSRGASVEAGEFGLIQMPLSLGAFDNVVDGSSSFNSPNTVSFDSFEFEFTVTVCALSRINVK